MLSQYFPPEKIYQIHSRYAGYVDFWTLEMWMGWREIVKLRNQFDNLWYLRDSL